MSEKLILVGIHPDIAVIEMSEQVVWQALSGNLRIEFDPRRSPFDSNVFQAPAGNRLQSGPPRPGVNPGSYKYRLFLNDQLIGDGEILIRPK
ncbi:MAG: hypothetical protein WA755_19835 [Candidatus Acidiferrales bacterium]